jgi:D-aspartate ligase
MRFISDTAAPAPAVVVGAAGACGLGIVRSLSQAGIPVILVDVTPYAPAMFTRFARKAVISQLSGQPLVNDLLALADGIGSPAVLFLTSDEAMLTVSKHRAELSSKYRFTLPSHDCLVSLAQKTTFQDLAESLGFPVPRSVKVASVADVDKVADLQFPAVVKPTTKTAAYVSGKFARGYKVFSREEAESKCRLVLTAVPEMVVQEWIEGPDTELYFCLMYRSADGSTLCSFVGRKLSVWPPDIGLTASCCVAPKATDELVRLTQAFFNEVSFCGMGGIEFKKNTRTGRFVMIEPTVGRVDAQEEVATIHGVNIPLIAYLHESGLPLPPICTNRMPAIWRNSWAHWRAILRNNNQLAHARGLKVVDAYWRFNDPLPAVAHSFGWSIRSLAKALLRPIQHGARVNSCDALASDRTVRIASEKSTFRTG